jgi:hypothetical protein
VCQNASPSPSPPIDFRRHRVPFFRAVGAGDAVLLLDKLAGVELQFAELAGERHVLLIGHRHAAEAQYQIIEPRFADRVAVGGREGLANVDAADIGTAAGGEGGDFNGHGLLLIAPRAAFVASFEAPFGRTSG